MPGRDAPNQYHTPVLTEAVLRLLVTDRAGAYIDGTVGGGGHARAILSILEPGARFLGIDVDPEALSWCRKSLPTAAENSVSLHLRRGSYTAVEAIAHDVGIDTADGVLLDLGVSTHQIGTPQRGFSYLHNGSLDMRMDPDSESDASAIVNAASKEELTAIFRKFGEEPKANLIARAIVRTRNRAPITTTGELARLIRRTVGVDRAISTAARVFQALRIAVNDELDNLRHGLAAALALLRTGGRIVVLSYHSLEDRIVKQFLRYESLDCVCPPGLPVCQCGKIPTIEVLTRRIVKSSQAEIAANIRARSARLRAGEKL